MRGRAPLAGTRPSAVLVGDGARTYLAIEVDGVHLGTVDGAALERLALAILDARKAKRKAARRG